MTPLMPNLSDLFRDEHTSQSIDAPVMEIIRELASERVETIGRDLRSAFDPLWNTSTVCDEIRRICEEPEADDIHFIHEALRIKGENPNTQFWDGRTVAEYHEQCFNIKHGDETTNPDLEEVREMLNLYKQVRGTDSTPQPE